MLRKSLAALVLVLAAAPALSQTRAGKSDFFFSPTFVNGQNFTVSQAQTTCSYSLDRTTLDVAADGETQMIQVTTSD